MTKARMTNGCAKCPRPNEEGPIPKAFGAKSKARAWLGIWVLELLWALGICHRAFHQGGCLSGRAGGRGYPCGMGNMDWNGRSGRRWTKNGTRLRGDAAARQVRLREDATARQVRLRRATARRAGRFGFVRLR